MELSTAIRDRICNAADLLYEEEGRRTLPTVDAVRKQAKVNMNDACVGMRAWRRMQSAQAEIPAVQVPDALQRSAATALNALWMEALTEANQTLRAAQASWDADRIELETMSEQLANAYEKQAAELALAIDEINSLKQEVGRLHDAGTAHRRRTDEAEHEAITARTAAARSDARAEEIERRADDLRLALDQAHTAHTAAAEEHISRLHAQDAELTKLRNELSVWFRPERTRQCVPY